MLLVKKYGNRRLYDTGESRYITLEELEEKIHLGVDVRVLDAKTGTDLTQSTLAQIILESRGAAALLPVPLLTQMVRMGDDLLIEFLTRYLASALELYLQARQGAQAVAPYNPFAALPFRMLSGPPSWAPEPQQMSVAPAQWVSTNFCALQHKRLAPAALLRPAPIRLQGRLELRELAP